MLDGQKLPGSRFTLSYQDVEEFLLERGIVVTCESIHTWRITFSDLFAHGLRHREPRRGSRWHLDDMHVEVGGVTHSLWRAVDERGAMLDVFLQHRRGAEAARLFFRGLLGADDVPEVIHTDKVRRYGAAWREFLVLNGVEHLQVVSTDRCNTLIEQSYRPTRRQKRSRRSFRSHSSNDHVDVVLDAMSCFTAPRFGPCHPPGTESSRGGRSVVVEGDVRRQDHARIGS